MAATVFFCEDNGAAAGTPASGARTTGVTQMNWKNTDDVNTVYSTSPITAGNNSYSKYQYGCFSGTFNQVLNLKWQHVSGTVGAGLTIKGAISGSGLYATPATTTNAALIYDFTITGDISTGRTVLVGVQGPAAGGKASSSVTSPSFSEYLATQLQTTTAAAAGDITTCTFQLQYDEN